MPDQVYERKPDRFKFIQYTGSNAEELNAWLTELDHPFTVLSSEDGSVIYDPGTSQSRPPTGLAQGQCLVLRLHDGHTSVENDADRFVPVES